MKEQETLKAKGVDEVIVFCVNDAAVMQGWAKDQGVEGSIITFMADPRRELTEALDVVLDHPGPVSVLGTPRCKRFACLVVDGIINSFHISESEGDPAGDSDPSAVLVENLLKDVETLHSKSFTC